MKSGRLAYWKFWEMETRKSLHNALKEADHRGIITQRLIATVLMATGAITFLGRDKVG